MEHHVRALANPIGAGESAALAGAGVAHLERFRRICRNLSRLWEGRTASPASQPGHLSATWISNNRYWGTMGRWLQFPVIARSRVPRRNQCCRFEL
jgi:hypothetical protein